MARTTQLSKEKRQLMVSNTLRRRDIPQITLDKAHLLIENHSSRLPLEDD